MKTDYEDIVGPETRDMIRATRAGWANWIERRWTVKHIGLHANRLDPRADNPREVAFARQWAKENEDDRPGTRCSAGNILRTLVPDAKQRDATVAATLMQWLGSNVGMCFLCDVIRDSPEVRRWILSRWPNASLTGAESVPSNGMVVPYDLCRCVECGWQDQFRRDCIAADGRVDGHCDRCKGERTFYRHNDKAHFSEVSESERRIK